MSCLRFSILACFLLTIIMIGCSGGSNPLTPQDETNFQPNSYSSLPVAVSDFDSNGRPIAGQGFIGIYAIHLDKSSLAGEIQPLRNSASTDVLEVVDITNFLQMSPCNDCVRIFGVELDADSHLVAQIGIKHPFPAGDPMKPITGRNRADLHVFNVEGLVVSDGTATASYPGIGKTVGNVGLINADGYSSYLDESLDAIFPTVSNVHPYMLHFDDYSAGNYNPANAMGFESVVDPPPSGNLVMAMGCDYDTQSYVFDISGSFDFIFAVGCTYALSSDNKAQRFTPVYHVPQHNKKAASEIVVNITNNELSDGDDTSFADMEIRVVDINHGVPVGTALNEMVADSSVGDVLVEVPGVTSSTVSFGSAPTSGTGHDPSDPLVFTGKIYNTAMAAEGTYTGLVKVTDTYPVGTNSSPLLNGSDGIKRVDPLLNPLTGVFNIDEFATYMPFSIAVGTSNELPQCAIFRCGGAAPSVNIGTHLRLDGTQSYDTDGTIETYEWDFDYDGTTFTSDATGEYAWFTGSSAGTFTVALRVTDDQGGQSICTTEIVCSGNPREWLPSVRVTDTGNDWYDRVQWPNNHSLDVSDDCVVHLVYFSWKTTYPYVRDVLYTKFDGTSWTPPELVYHFDNSYVMSVAMELDSNDKIRTAWCISNEIWYADNTSGTFAVQSLNSGDLGYENLSLAVNKDDHVMIAVAEDFLSTYPQFIRTYYNDGSGFGSVVNAGSYCNARASGGGVVIEPDLCSSPDGNFHVVYNGLINPPCPATDSSREVYYSEFDGATWTEYGPISNMAGDCHQPRVFSDMNNNLYCVVGGYSYIYYSKRDSISHTWSAFDYITDNLYMSFQPDLGIDKWGNAYLVWSRYDSGTSAYYSYYKIFNVADDLTTIRSTPSQQLPLGGGGQNAYAHVHVDFDGDMHVVYEDRTLDEWVNTELYYMRYH